MRCRLKYDNYRDCNYFELTLIRLIFIIVMCMIKENVDGNKRAYLHRLDKKIFGDDMND